jgi:hypothetical protein
MTVTMLWAVKGGSGTTVTAAALALKDPRDTLLVDLAGELPTALGLPEPSSDGITDWLATDTPAATLDLLAVDVNRTTRLLPRGHTNLDPHSQRWAEFATWAAARPAVVIDAGTTEPPPALLDNARGLLVTRPCYLALRRAVQTTWRPDAVILVTEPGRALKAPDVERALGVPVVAQISIDPAVARAVDAGLLAARVPTALRNAVGPLNSTSTPPRLDEAAQTATGDAAAHLVNAWRQHDPGTTPEPPPLDIA